MLGHVNLYLKRSIRRRAAFEYAAAAFAVASFIAYFQYSRLDIAFGCVCGAVWSLYCSIKYMIDESNTNYLMHWWDLRHAIAYHQGEEEAERRRTLAQTSASP